MTYKGEHLFQGFLVNRSLKTLAIRMREHMANGLKVAKYLETNPRIVKVIYPGKPFFIYRILF